MTVLLIWLACFLLYIIGYTYWGINYSNRLPNKLDYVWGIGVPLIFLPIVFYFL